MSWDLETGRSYTAQTLPYPSVNLSVTNTEVDVTGLTRRCYYRHLRGAGYAVGARFRPGGFRPLLGGPVSDLTDRHRPMAEVLGRDTAELARRVAEDGDPGARVGLLADFLAEDWPDPDPTVEQVAGLVDRGRGGPRHHPGRPGGRAGRADGAQPAAALRRVRRRRAQVGDPALPAAGRGAPAWRPRNELDWAELATELGFSDQAHLTRAFTATIGVPPATYARQAHVD